MNPAHDAFGAFYSGTHDKCGQLLEQLSNSKGSFDVKLQHNTLINEYYKSGCRDPQALLTQLSQAYDRVREKDKKDNGRQKRDEEDEETYREDEDLSVLRYNQALLCLQLRQYAQASLILEELFVNIEPIDDFLAIKICFLLLELCLLQREPEQAFAVLAYLEKPNAFLTVLRSERPKGVEPSADVDTDDITNGSQAKDTELVDGLEASSETIGAAELQAVGGSSDKRSAVVAAPEEPPEGPLPSLTVGSFMPRHGRPPDNISRAEYRFFVLMYRARLALALKNNKAAKKDVKSALEVLDQDLHQAPLLTAHPHTTGPPGTKGGRGKLCEVALREGLHHQHSAMVLTLKAYLEYSRQNVRKSIKLLTLCQFNFAQGKSNDDENGQLVRTAKGGVDDGDDDPIPTDFHPAEDDACSAVFFNNVGCIHFLTQKPNLATYFFQKALKASMNQQVEVTGKANVNGSKHDNLLGGKSGLTLPGVLVTKNWLDRKAEINFNAGLQMLMSERPSVAFKCFEQCIPVFRTWPRLWLRLAECCVEMHRQHLEPVSGGEACSNSDGVPSCMSATWSRETSSHSQVAGCSRALVWGIQGTGANRRWLLTTARDAPMGKRSGADEEESGAKGNATLPPPSVSSLAPGNQRDAPIMESDAALSHAAMCLRNVLVLVMPMLPEKISSSAGVKDSTAEASKSSTSGAVKASTSSTSGSGSRHQARDLLQSDASLLEDAALIKLAYVCLCQHDHASALRYSRRLLEKNHLLLSAGEGSKEGGKQTDDAKSMWTFQSQNFSSSAGASPAKHPSSVGSVTLAVMYLSEALLLAGKATEAQSLLSGFISCDTFAASSELEGVVGSSRRSGSGTKVTPDTTTCDGSSPRTPMGGLTPPWYCSAANGSAKDHESKGEGEKEKSKDSGPPLVPYPITAMPRLGDTQCMLRTNLAALHAQDGNLAEAERCCEQA
eukprot:CAMPEP_0169156240 /NCGR_PEP_ID=MMETSP1015-20121227/53873_1 /TAXON_ID=342587 /ORGANISM="Karlodinium micrum, Strain CCMP2283" /LENGTH=950 /DNA_ID=CAMNT_0009226951 /DNA_START=46 /DNA_END=2894 /DNA_ORIENTATION=+